VHPTAQLGVNVRIGPFCVIGEHCTLGDNVQLANNVTLQSHVILEEGVHCSPGVVLGAAPQDTKFKGETSWVHVGAHTQLREYVTIHRATGENETTRVGSHCLLMCNSHVGHNSQVGHRVTLANAVLLAGHVTLNDFVVMGGASCVHQGCEVGAYSMLGGLSGVRQNVPPFVMYSDWNVFGVNTVGLRRAGFTIEQRKDIRMGIKLLCFSQNPLSERTAVLESLYRHQEHMKPFLQFIETLNKRGIADSGTSKRFNVFQLKELALQGLEAPELEETANETGASV
jgi:UDP-N-acetylglucosamine acyltransferase